MPQSVAESTEQAQKLLLEQVTQAMSATLKELSVGFEKTSATDDETTEFYFYSDELGCPQYEQGMTNRDLCYMRAQIIEPYLHISLILSRAVLKPTPSAPTTSIVTIVSK